MNLVTVLSTSITKLVRTIKVKRYGKNDIRTPDEASAYGIDSNPVKDMRAIYIQGTDDENDVIIGYINKNQKAKVGEIRLFSTTSTGTEKFYVWLRDSGEIEIGGDTNWGVKYTELKAELDKLKQDHNTLATAHDTHLHQVLSIPTTPPTAPSNATNASDFSKAKNDKIKTIG